MPDIVGCEIWSRHIYAVTAPDFTSNYVRTWTPSKYITIVDVSCLLVVGDATQVAIQFTHEKLSTDAYKVRIQVARALHG